MHETIQNYWNFRMQYKDRCLVILKNVVYYSLLRSAWEHNERHLSLHKSSTDGGIQQTQEFPIPHRAPQWQCCSESLDNDDPGQKFQHDLVHLPAKHNNDDDDDDDDDDDVTTTTTTTTNNPAGQHTVHVWYVTKIKA